MSYPDRARNVQTKSRNKLHARSYAEAVSEALQQSIGVGGHAVKRLSNLVDVSLRTSRNWLEAKNGPTGAELIELMKRDDAVFRTVCELADRTEQLPPLTRQQQEAVKAMLKILEGDGHGISDI